MKMNFKYVSMMACAALMAGFTSCSNDDADVNAPVEGVKTFAKFSLTQNTATRVDEPATGTEGMIYSATMYVFDNVKKLEASIAFDDIASGAATASKVVEITTGSKYFYVVANTTAPTFTNGTTLDNVIAHANNAKTLSAGLSEIIASGKYMMTSIGDPTAQTLVEATQAEAAAKNPIALKIGRAMAKVRLKPATAGMEQPKTGSLSISNFLVANNPTKMYILPNFTLGQVQAPFFADATTGTYFPTLGTDETGLIWSAANGIAEIYTPENSNEVPRKGNATFALIKGVFTPAIDCTYDAAGVKVTTALTAGTTFYCATKADGSVIGGLFFTAAPTKTIVAGLLGVAESEIGASFVTYTNGVSYYPLYLKDDAQATATAKYTVPRNHIFDVQVTSVSGIGANTVGGVLPEDEKPDPLEGKTWVEATITVLPWTLINQESGI